MTTKLSLTEFLKNNTDEASHLPRLPTADELSLIRKGLRKKKIPDISLLPNEFGYEGVGYFHKKSIDDSLVFQWTTSSHASPRIRSYKDLCINQESENDRLEFGWMIANFARIDAISYLSKMRPISYSDYHQNEFVKQYNSEKDHFERIENVWRHWSIVPAGHMIFQ